VSSQGRKHFIAGNWKMNKTVAESLAFGQELRVASLPAHVELAVAPPFPSLQPLAKQLEGSPVRVAAQNCHWEVSGAFTGEVSAGMCKEAGCQYVIVGHSERRQYFGETDATVNKRARAVIRAGMWPIVCVGETLAEREAGKTFEVISRQLAGGLVELRPEEMAELVLAYEPVWAIGTGRNATSVQAQEVHAHIREQLTRTFGREAAERTRIQYGGSVKPENAAELLAQPDVDGALVGGASLKVSDFLAIARAAT
jgi:triosephosphate isomerase